MGSNRAKTRLVKAGRSALRAGLWNRIAWLVGGAVVLGLAVIIALSVTAPPPPELEAVDTYPDMGVVHLADGAPVPEYNSDPPTSGPHAAVPAPCGIYRQPVPDISALHSMEHGAVVIQYDPGLEPARRDQIEDIARSLGGEVLVAPRPDNPANIALTAWTKRLLLNEIDETVISAFDAGFANRSPEGGAACPFQVDDSAEGSS